MKYWFKRRRYGWGWIPVTWQGWLIILVYLAVVIWAGFEFEQNRQSDGEPNTELFIMVMVASVLLLLLITYTKGPKPKWRWGKKPDDNPEEDW